MTSPTAKPAAPTHEGAAFASAVAALPAHEAIRAEIYGIEHLEAHARRLAAHSRQASPAAPSLPLLTRLHRLDRSLRRAHAEIAAKTQKRERISTDAEWLLDNFHIVVEALQEIRHDLPRGYYDVLPKLTAGPLKTYPRVYALALELLAHTDSSLDEPNITRFVAAFQSETPLTIGELWAIPIMLRLGLLENLSRLAEQMLRSFDARAEAESFKAHVLRHVQETTTRPADGAAPPPRSNWSDPFLVHLFQILRDHGPEAGAGIDWLESFLAERGDRHGDVVRREHQRQAGNQVTVGNCVTSLRLLSTIDWQAFFERASRVDAVLNGDPARVYSRQDFATRDRYRQAVEMLARYGKMSEVDVAERAIALCREGPPGAVTAPHASDSLLDVFPAAHVGYYLTGPGRARLEKEAGYHPRFLDRLRALLLTHAKPVYFTSLLAIGAVILAAVLAYAWLALPPGTAFAWSLAAVFLLTLLPGSEIAVGLLHYLLTLVLPPRVLPKLDPKEGIPEGCATFVVMPTMLLDPESARILTERLEIHYLSNPDPQLRFALLTDFADAVAEQMPEDERYLRDALERIRALNERYCRGGPDRFFLCHRRRVWNARESCWMGWERKRGKLAEFNRLLRGARDTDFTVLSGDVAQPPRVRFVITLDADTQLPREASQRLVATLAHPLNRPRFAPSAGRVVDGYGVLQPRVSLNLVAASRSLFARISGNPTGLDPYTTAVSDVYQDLFGIGSFTGKGIYDVDAFQEALGDRFPDNHILSHDLIEGNFARCALVTDIEVLDDFPAHYPAYARREHRWVRGDWQLLPWLGRRVPQPAADGSERRPNPLSAVERWKMLDNLRRSLVPPALVLLLIFGWTVLPGSAWFWTALVVLVPALPLVWQLSGDLLAAVRGRKPQVLSKNLGVTAAQALLKIVFLPSEAQLLVDAIVRTLARLYITRRHLLEWETAASAERRLGTTLPDFYAAMWFSPTLAALLGALLVAIRPTALFAAAPLLIAWFAAPAIGYWVSRPRARREPPLTAVDRLDLRRFARRTWAFFETFVGPDDHWLPPDNYQEDPKGEVAHRTSPTNMGLYLMSCLAAHDLGYLDLTALVDRLENTFATFGRLERYRGHFYNWYDTQTLQPLQPHYVSTVDSGNLMACLVEVQQGLQEQSRAVLPAPALCDALGDILGLAAEALRTIEPTPGDAPNDAFASVEARIRKLHSLLHEPPVDLLAYDDWLNRVDQAIQELRGQVLDVAHEITEIPEDLERWVQGLAERVHEAADELGRLAPWVAVLRASAANPEATFADPGAAVRWRELREALLRKEKLSVIEERLQPAQAEAAALAAAAGQDPATASLLTKLQRALAQSGIPDLRRRCRRLRERAAALVGEVDLKFLYNAQRHLFCIGYNATTGRLDNAHYDLLASEACLTSFLAIARGDVPKRHWFQLSRPLTDAPGGLALLSWGGTMFEYLLPRLFLRPPEGTLLAESWRAAVDRQIEYGDQNGVPWGISESSYSAVDVNLDYQYQSFGVPGLGLKRGLSRDLVIAPYATALALAIHPRLALDNLRTLAAEQVQGPYGFYEAVDYTRERLRDKRRFNLVRSFMAHHQGMSLVAMANCLLGEPAVRRFQAEPIVRATELLLQERQPQDAPVVEPHADEARPEPIVRDAVLPMSRVLTSPDTPQPRVHLISNRRYSVMLTNAGAGYSRCRDLDVTRWREDTTTDAWGQFIYVRDLVGGRLWSVGHQPLCRPADEYEVILSTDKAEIRRRDRGIEIRCEITVSPENNAEVRRLTITNHNPRSHTLELTSYAEVALAPHGADVAHPAFAKLFLETDFLAGQEALLCRRRPRAADEKPVWAVHVLAVEGTVLDAVQYETDRCRFLGRGRSPANPLALEPGTQLSGTTGAVLDPIFSLRRRVRVAAGGTVSVAFTTAVAESQDEARALADQYHDFHGVTRAFELAWAHSQVELRHLHLAAEEAHVFQRLAAALVYTGPVLRDADAIAANRQGQPGLWRYGISGDLPILLLRIADARDVPLVRSALVAHAYLRLKGLVFDLVIVNEHPATYLEELHQEIQSLIRVSDAHTLIDKPGGVFLRRGEQFSADDLMLVRAAARVVLVGERGALASQIEQKEQPAELPEPLPITERRAPHAANGVVSAAPAGASLLFANGWGGFRPDGREYVMTLLPPKAPGDPWRLPPAPWCNVVANPNFGFLVSEAGGGYTWAANSQANRLTPWNNDPVTDPPGEAIYLRDENSGEFWSTTPLPRGPLAPWTVRHGQGYTVFSGQWHGLVHELTLFVAADDPVKLMHLKIRNSGSSMQRLSATLYAEWVLGGVRERMAGYVVTEVEPESGALLARNAFNSDFAPQLAFADVNLRPRSYTADRTEFIGRNGSTAAPAAMGRVGLSENVGAGLDPCCAITARFDLKPGAERDVVFVLGQAETMAQVQTLALRYRDARRAREALAEVKDRWEKLLGTVQVRTPDPALDLLLNRWLLYQVISCRLWGRSAFYQSGGAFGFRDQLQDVMALVHAAPAETRAQLLRAAARQFVEGDVQHWWHPPVGRGVRTRISDDLLWLPFVTCQYVEATGDTAVLDEEVPFLRAPELRPEQEEDYGLPEVTAEKATLYEHCLRALQRGSRFGVHGLPLMGTGDWNDGMNRVGAGGKGESVWDAWFLVTVLRHFADVTERKGDLTRAADQRALAERVRAAVEQHAWDGRWYRRAYFDDGTPLGSAEDDECKIDSIAQSWGAISGAADPERLHQALQSVEEHLVREQDRLILLFTPPFDQGKLQPGYVKGYVPGIRENGGQYTHAATWVVLATALTGNGRRAFELFNMLNPIEHSRGADEVAQYRVEPYVVAADVYGQAPHTGRGGWTWYTGSASWLYRVGLEAILGCQRRGDTLHMNPCVPAAWRSYALTYRHGSATYEIVVENPNGVEQGVTRVEVDGVVSPDKEIRLLDDGRRHDVRIIMG